MANYMLIWNPDNFTFKQFDKEYSDSTINNETILKWACKNRNAKIDDKVFLLVLGVDKSHNMNNFGICATGIVTESSFEDVHWDNRRNKSNRFIKFKVEKFFHPKKEILLTREVLKDRVINISNPNWVYQFSGALIPNVTANKLLSVWEEFVLERML